MLPDVLIGIKVCAKLNRAHRQAEKKAAKDLEARLKAELFTVTDERDKIKASRFLT